jgi:D-glycero-D-manno-heptose 1,7-bisphosphate phosphatase
MIENRPGHVLSWGDVALIPSVVPALKRLNLSSFRTVVITNQAAIGRGLISLDEAMAINSGLDELLLRRGCYVDAWYTCPHRPDDHCPCRKPQPGMLTRAAADMDLSLQDSVVVGDAETDLLAGLAAGARAILVLTGRGPEQAAELSPDLLDTCPIVPDVAAAVSSLMAGAL